MTEKVSKSIGNLLIRYERSAAIRALVQLVPLGIGGAADTFAATKVEQIRENRARAFFDELERNKAELTPEIVNSEDFLHCFFATSAAALRTRRTEKIKLFARLLASSISDNPPKDTDDFEDLLGILDELTYTEWRALLILDRHALLARMPNENDLQWSKKFWVQFRAEIETEINISSEEFTSFMNRISRTGLYEQIVGVFWDYEGGVGMLTPKYFRLKNFVSSETKS